MLHAASPAVIGSAFQDAPVGMVLAAPRAGALDVNAAWCALTGLTVGASLRDGWLDVLAPSDQARLRRLVARVTAAPPHPAVDLPLGAPATIRWGRWAASRTLAPDGSEAVLVTLIDTTGDHVLADRLRHAATHDPLTGAANRSLFLEAARHALARLRRHPGSVGVLFVDLDGFKGVNDRWGHDVGDRVLITQVHRLREALRPQDVLARLGGDEFAVLCEDVNGPGQVRTIARRAASRLAEPIETRGGDVAAPASIGAVIVNAPTASAEHLVDVADRAMYRAKRLGGPPHVVVDLDGAGRERRA